jgi:tRNA(adenine34) deaminase
MQSDFYNLIKQALEEAKVGFLEGEVPVGAVIAGPDGQIIARAHNQPIALNDPCAHAEIIAIRKAGNVSRNYRLNNTVLAVTIEPCLMCMGAIINARIGKLLFGAFDPKAGAVGSLYNLASDQRLNHRVEVISGILEDECRALMQDFFRHRRKRLK